MDERMVQEHAANVRQDDVVQEAQNVRTRVLQGLDALERELKRVRAEAEKYPNLPPPEERGRKRWLPW